MTLTVGGMFSGISGIERGLTQTGGFEVRWLCEIDEYCRAVLHKRWPGVPIYGDARELNGHLVERVDLLAGGFPCTDLSSAGARAGIEGEHSGLWTEMARLVREIRPRYVLVENVPALLVRGMGRVLRDLAASGYDAEWDCLPAAAFGAPHLRARIWLLAYPSGLRDGASPPTIFAGRESPELRPWWSAEPRVDRLADGVSNVVAELKALGNAVIPQAAEHVGNLILDLEASRC